MASYELPIELISAEGFCGVEKRLVSAALDDG
jgi:hypothetical protein